MDTHQWVVVVHQWANGQRMPPIRHPYASKSAASREAAIYRRRARQTGERLSVAVEPETIRNAPMPTTLRGAHRYSANAADYMRPEPVPRWPGDTQAAHDADIAQAQAEAIGWASR